MKRGRHVRALFVSDLHLGTRGCQADLFLDFLRHHEADTIYLVGDIVDGWRLRSGWYWPESHNTIVQKLLRQARRGTRIVYVPGNHDDFARDYAGLIFGGIEIAREALHVTADGRRFHVTHGDEFDIVVRHARWLAFLGDRAYTAALFVNTQFNRVRRCLGLPYWSLSAWAKLKVKNAVNFIGAFERALTDQAAQRNYDGVICGHIHHAMIRPLNGITYVNIGDFVESCTAVVEDDHGTLELVWWLAPGAMPDIEPVDAITTFALPEVA
jgi:UDP-2,3-diacylglucosamine pyrophosphatase LpxH